MAINNLFLNPLNKLSIYSNYFPSFFEGFLNQRKRKKKIKKCVFEKLTWSFWKMSMQNRGFWRKPKIIITIILILITMINIFIVIFISHVRGYVEYSFQQNIRNLCEFLSFHFN